MTFKEINKNKRMDKKIHDFMQEVSSKNSGETEFLQAVEEVAEAVIPFMDENPKYNNKMLLERMIEPERIIIFRVPWTDDNGNVQVNRGYRVEFNSAIGPYKGGLRFHPSVNLSILKFLDLVKSFTPLRHYQWEEEKVGLILIQKAGQIMKL